MLFRSSSSRAQLLSKTAAKKRSRRKQSRRLITEQLENRMLLAVTPIISEFLASNSGGLRDIDGETSDWIEIFNPTSSPVDLGNWMLTDDATEIDQWSFPSVVIQPDEYLIVFASDKDRAVAGEQLHTNFRLSSGGDFLALAQPDGTIVSQFSPQYPAQNTNISFGSTFVVDPFVQAGSAASTLVPTNGSVVSGAGGAAWQTAGFDDSGWTSGAIGIGFGVGQLGFDVRYVKARSTANFNGEVTSLAIAESVLSTPDRQSLVVEQNYPTINFRGTGGGGNFAGDVPFPNQQPGDDINHFVIEANSTIVIPTTGPWSFGVNSDDGFGLTLSNGVDTFSSSFLNTAARLATRSRPSRSPPPVNINCGWSRSRDSADPRPNYSPRRERFQRFQPTISI